VKFFIMTDQEGAAGVIDKADYSGRASRFWERARTLVTAEVNAAIEGVLETGDHEFLVVDGHGPMAIDVAALHPRARVLTGRPIEFPFGLDASFDAMMFVAQHAKANADGGHLSHTMSFAWEDLRLNDLSIGELGYYMALGGELGVPTIFVSGDRAVCDEARDLVSEIVVAPVKEGVRRGSALGLTQAEAERFNGAAVHMPPPAARDLIRRRAREAVQALDRIPPFVIPPPFDLVTVLRPDVPGGPRRFARNTAPTMLELGRQPREFTWEYLDEAGARARRDTSHAGSGSP
jgi:D-amino peptidase